MAAFASEWVAAFTSEWVAGFVGIRKLIEFGVEPLASRPRTDTSPPLPE